MALESNSAPRPEKKETVTSQAEKTQEERSQSEVIDCSFDRLDNDATLDGHTEAIDTAKQQSTEAVRAALPEVADRNRQDFWQRNPDLGRKLQIVHLVPVANGDSDVLFNG